MRRVKITERVAVRLRDSILSDCKLLSWIIIEDRVESVLCVLHISIVAVLIISFIAYRCV